MTGCFGGTPFPVPKTGHEAMWNLILANKGASSWTYGQAWYVDASGNKVMTAEVNNRNQNDYFNPKLTAEQFYAKGGQYLMNNNIYTAPARITGEGNLQRKYINPVSSPDKTWTLHAGPAPREAVARRLRTTFRWPRRPARCCTTRSTASRAGSTASTGSSSARGRCILPYNAYKYLPAKPDDVLMKGGPNPDVLRWELHRVHRGRGDAEARRAPRRREAALLLRRGHTRTR